MVRRTCTAIAVLAQADTQLSPMGVAWSTNALIACSLRMGSQEPSVHHGPIVLRWPRKRAGNAISPRSKKANTGGVRIEPGWSPPHWSFVRLLSHPKHKPHVRTHVDPGRAPRRHPHLRETPYYIYIYMLFRSVRTYSKLGGKFIKLVRFLCASTVPVRNYRGSIVQ